MLVMLVMSNVVMLAVFIKSIFLIVWLVVAFVVLVVVAV